MKIYSVFLCILLSGFASVIFLNGCGEKKKSQAELALGSWSQEKDRAHILLNINPKGEWNSSVKIPEAGSRVVKTSGKAKGVWNIDKNQMIFTVMESDIDDVWIKGGTVSYDIVGLTGNRIQLKDESGAVMVFSGAGMEKEAGLALSVPMAPVVVNISKAKSNDKDRYLCLKMSLILKELMPGQKSPVVHPKVHDAIIIFLSSLVYDDVKDFHGIEVQSQRLVNILNPHMEGTIKKIAVENVILTAEIDKVDEFMIAQALPTGPAPEKGKGAKDGKKEEKSSH